MMEPLGQQVQEEPLVLWVQQVLKVFLVLKVHWALLAQLAHRELPEKLVPLVRKVLREHLLQQFLLTEQFLVNVMELVALNLLMEMEM